MAQEVAYTITTPTGLHWGLPTANKTDQSSRGANFAAAVSDAESSATGAWGDGSSATGLRCLDLQQSSFINSLCWPIVRRRKWPPEHIHQKCHPPPPQILIIIKKSQTRQIKLTEIWNKKLLTKRQSSKFPPWNIWQHSDSVYAVFFTHLFRLRWISLLKINKYRSKQTQERQLLHFCPADLNLRHLFSYNPSHRKFIYTDRAFWNSAGLVNLQHSQCMSFSIKITLSGCSMPRVNIWADEG